MFVVDTSVTMAWCFEDEASAGTDAVLDRLRVDVAVVPGLWHLEVANVLAVAERRRRVTEAQSARFLTLLDQLPIQVEPQSASTQELLAAARRHALAAYDAAYLLLAQNTGSPLATLDTTLRAACEATGVALLPEG